MSMPRSLFSLVFALGFVAPVLADTYTEDFAQPDGPPEGWVVVSPTVTVQSEVLTLAAGSGAEVDVIAGQGGDALWFESVSHIEFDIAYPGDTNSWPYDHGGVIFGAQQPAGRYGTNTCYVVDYLAAADGQPEVGRFRLGRFIDGAEAGIIQTEVNITEYEGKWEIDLTETTVTFTFNGVEQFSVEDTQVPRTGYVGFWAYQVPAENRLEIDNVEIEHTPGPCPTFLTDQVVMTEGRENALLPVRIPIGANATEAYEVAVTSMDTATATPADATLIFPAGGPLVQPVEIQPGAAGQTLLSLTVDGEDCSGVTAVAEVLASVSFFDDFTQEDGPPEDWFVAGGTAEVIGNELSLSEPGNADNTSIAWFGLGGVALNVPKIDAVRCRIRFAQAALPVGAHGGMYLSPAAVAARAQGYMLDVIERESDNGFRVYKDNNAAVGSELIQPRPPYVWDDQWHDWELEFTPTGFDFSVDGVLIGSAEDLTYRGGFLGFWCYTGAAGQNMFVDDVTIEFGSSACPTIAPLEAINHPANPKTVFTLTAPFGAAAAGDYELTVTSTDPTVAVPVGAVDGSLVVNFPQTEQIATATFEAECLSPGTTEFVLDLGETSCLNTTATFTVQASDASGFCDDLAQADGVPENWTVYRGDWQVVGEKLVTECADTSGGFDTHWAWAGSPPLRLDAVDSISFTLDLTQTTADAVGRHGGVMFCADAPTTRRLTRGYTVDWIDRDGGYRLLRWKDNASPAIGEQIPEEPVLGTDWLIEFDGERILISVDDVLIFDVVDATYREGYFGLWTYCNTTHAEFDDIEVGTCGVSFIRGEANGDGEVNISDSVAVLNWLFGTGAEPGCLAAVDANGDGQTNISDPVLVLNYLFSEGSPPPAPPYPDCGLGELASDETLGCITPPAKCQ